MINERSEHASESIQLSPLVKTENAQNTKTRKNCLWSALNRIVNVLPPKDRNQLQTVKTFVCLFGWLVGWLVGVNAP